MRGLFLHASPGSKHEKACQRLARWSLREDHCKGHVCRRTLHTCTVTTMQDGHHVCSLEARAKGRTC
jgi:hypothetical protein